MSAAASPARHAVQKVEGFKSGRFFVIMCDIDSGAAGRRDARACSERPGGGSGGWAAGAAKPVQPDKRVSATALLHQSHLARSHRLGPTLAGRSPQSPLHPPILRDSKPPALLLS